VILCRDKDGREARHVIDRCRTACLTASTGRPPGSAKTFPARRSFGCTTFRRRTSKSLRPRRHLSRHRSRHREIDAASFPLPRLAPKLADLRQTLLNGIGFRVLRGLPVGRLSQEVAAAIFCGIGCASGPRAVAERRRAHPRPCARPGRRCQRPQHAHLPDIGAADLSHRQRRRRGSLCLREAMEGGDSLLVSVETIYNRMRAARPDLLALCSIRSRRTGGARCPRA
jgi:hypothetical protein